MERLRSSEACAHCLETHAQKRARDKNAAPCLVSADGDLLVCTSVLSKSDLLSDDWEFIKPSVTWAGGVIKRKQADPAAQKFAQRLKALQTAATSPEISLRERQQLLTDVARIERQRDRAEQARIDGNRQEKEEAEALVRKRTAQAEQRRRRGLSSIAPGLLPVSNKAIRGNLQTRLAGQHDGLLRQLDTVVRQPGRGAYPAMAASPFADSEGRFCVPHGSAVVLAADGNGAVKSMQVMNAPGEGAKYAYAARGSFVGSDDPMVRHLTTTTADGLVDGSALFGSFPVVAGMLSKVARSTVLVVDGALKSWVASLLTGAVALGSPGAQHRLNMHQLSAALREVEAGLAIRPEVLIAIDAGDVLNPSLMIATLIETRDNLVAAGWRCSFLWWGQTSKEDGHDIDELAARQELLGGINSTSFERITSKQLLALCPPEIRSRQTAALQRSRRSGAAQLTVEELEGLPVEVRVPENEEVYEYQPGPGGREAALLELMARGVSNILLSDPPGEGKTYWSGHLQPETLGARRLLRAGPNPMGFAEEFGWGYVLGKDQGRVLAPDGRIIRAARGETKFYREPNCIKGFEIETLRAANAVAGAVSACKQCEHRGFCSAKAGMYLADRIRSETEERLACDPSSIQPQNDYWDADGAKFAAESGRPAATIGIFDEADTLPLTTQLSITNRRISDTYKELERFMPLPFRDVVRFLRDAVRPKGHDVLMGTKLLEAMVRHLSAQVVLQASKADLSLVLALELERVKSDESPLSLCWLAELQQFLRRRTVMQMWLNKDGLQVAKRNNQLLGAIKSDGLMLRIFMDATSTTAEMERRLGLRFTRLQAAEPRQGPPVRNIQITGLGRLGFSRSPQQQMLLRRLKPLMPGLAGIAEQEADEKVGWIDIKRALETYGPNQRTSAWLSGSRGSNYLEDVQALVKIGCPTPNLTATAADWRLFTGQEIDPANSINTAMLINATNAEEGKRWVSFSQAAENVEYRRWARERTDRELLQGRGRGRFGRRPLDSPPLTSITITDVSLPWEVEVLEARDLLSEAVVKGVLALTSKRVEMAWEQSRYSKRRIDVVLQELQVDLPTLAERCRFDDLRFRPAGKAVLEAAANGGNYSQLSEATDTTGRITASVIRATGRSARGVA